jgi:hypothetical protein
MRGEIQKGLATLEKGHALGSTRPSWKHPSEAWVRDARERADVEKLLDPVRRGGTATAAERLAIALKICRPRKLFAEAARLCAQAFEADPSFLDEREQDWVLEAASSAVAAGLGAGEDAPADADSRRALREQARAWLERQLLAAEKEVSDADLSAGDAAARVRAWTKDRGLARVRTPADVEKLPADEAKAWRAFWARADALLARRPESAASRPTK